MDLAPYVENLRRELAVAAEAGGEDARALAERLTAPLESAIRLTLLDALSAAADEITRELAPGSVELRLRAGEPEFVVTPAPADEPAASPRRGARAARRATRPPRRASTSGCPSSSRPASSRPRAASGCPSTPGSSAPPPPRSRRRRPPPPPARRPDRPVLHRLGALTATGRSTTTHEPDPQEGIPMPTFDTPEPDLRHDRPRPRRRPDRRRRRAPTTVVEVRPSDASNEDDRKAAEQTRVEYADGQLLVKAPKQRSWLLAQAGGSVDVTIELPAGSQRPRRRRRRRLPQRRPRSATAGSRPASATSARPRPARSTLKSGTGDVVVDRVDRPRRDHRRLGRRARPRARRTAR